MTETQFHTKIKCFRSDNAPDLKLPDFFQNKGTLHQFSCVGNPQQKSVVERKHQNILQVARALGFNPIFLYIFGASVCYLLFTSLLGCLFHYCTTEVLVKSCLNTFPLILILEPLVPYVLFQLFHRTNPNLILGLSPVFSLVIWLVLKAIKFLI